MSGLSALAAYSGEDSDEGSTSPVGSLVVAYEGDSDGEHNETKVVADSEAADSKNGNDTNLVESEGKAQEHTSEARRADPELVERISKMIGTCKRIRSNLTDNLRGQHNHANPCLLEKLHETYDIDMIGTNFPQSVFDPHSIRDDDCCDKLLSQQSRATHKDAIAYMKTEGMAAGGNQRKSKWDNPTSASRLDAIATAQQAVARLTGRAAGGVAFNSAAPSTGNARADLARLSGERKKKSRFH